MEYSFFLFYSLLKDIPNSCPLIVEEYDTAFGEIISLYKIYEKSIFNTDDEPEYECMVKWIENKYPIQENPNGIKEDVIQYYEIDLDNCTMSHKDWASELAQAMSNPNQYWRMFRRNLREYRKEREA